MNSVIWFQRGLSLRQRFAFFISTAGGAGFSPVAPGTAGSLVAAVLYFAFGSIHWSTQLAIILSLLVLGIWASSETEKRTGLHDDGRIVIDEVIGTWVTLFALEPNIYQVCVGFFLFRILDILKPYPANWIDQKWPKGYGVVLDDVVSGIYAHALLRLAHHLSVLL